MKTGQPEKSTKQKTDMAILKFCVEFDKVFPVSVGHGLLALTARS